MLESVSPFMLITKTTPFGVVFVLLGQSIPTGG